MSCQRGRGILVLDYEERNELPVQIPQAPGEVRSDAVHRRVPQGQRLHATLGCRTSAAVLTEQNRRAATGLVLLRRVPRTRDSTHAGGSRIRMVLKKQGQHCRCIRSGPSARLRRKAN
jgi:hypothetical protein